MLPHVISIELRDVPALLNIQRQLIQIF